MNAPLHTGWHAANRRRLEHAFEAVRALRAGSISFEPLPTPALDPPARLDSLAATFGLDRLDQLLLLLAAAAELDPQSGTHGRPTVAEALAAGGEAMWTALCPQGPLRRWRMLSLDGAGPLRDRTLRLDERVVQHLLGIDYLDAYLDGLVEPLAVIAPTDADAVLAESLAAAWFPGEAGWPVLQLGGGGPEPRRAVAGTLAGAHRLRGFRIAAADVPRTGFERLALARLADRELALSGGLLVIEVRDGAADDEARGAAALADTLIGPVILSAREPMPVSRARLRADLAAPDPAERRAVWADALGPAAARLGSRLDDLAEQFALDAAGVRAVADLAGPLTDTSLFERLWDGARGQARQRLDELAERIEARVGWDDLVLPLERLVQLRDIAVHVRRSAEVHGRWGWAAKGARGLGVAALFAGPSGTGKTLAAEVLANELRLDLYRIDLSQVVSKYIGETEKNLRRIFEAAEGGGAILLFDEADALFGKRSEVKDSHDRYANVEVSYLLQRMESYRGLAILTSNLKGALDPAFMRRLRFVVDFPFPDAGLRTAIWQRIFPAATPTAGLDAARLARLGVAGGAIRTIAINAAFMAAEAGTPVGMAHVLAAARREYAKLEKQVTTAEFGTAP